MKPFCCAVGFVVAVVVAGFGAQAEASQLGPGFTYQGQLLQNGTPTTDPCDLQFSLFDAATGGNQLGSAQTVNEVRVTNGLFTVQLNSKGEFGVNALKGEARWLQIGVSCPASASPSFTVLAPRQNLTAAPYALYASAAGSAGGLSCNGCVAAGAIAAGAVTENALATHTITARSLAFSPGSVTSITAGTGLTGGTISTSGTISVGMVPVANGGTGASMASVARSNLGAAASGANADITSLSGITENIALPNSTSGNVGNILKGGTPFVHNFGTDNTFVGAEAGNFVLSGSSNSALGHAALSSNTNGSLNSAVGDHALFSNTNGFDNNAVGSHALAANTGGTDNNAVGYNALSSNTTGDFNNAVGTGALQSNTGGNETCVGPSRPLGCCSGAGTGSCGANNNAVGNNALYANTTGDSNNALGTDALLRNTTGTNNNAVGRGALQANITGRDNNAVGNNALSFNTTGDFNNAVGTGALHANNGGNETCTSASTPLRCCTGAGAGNCGTNNNAVGNNALYANTTGDSNNAMGTDALLSNTTGTNNNAVGRGALQGNITGGNNNAMGTDALLYNTTGFFNTAVGDTALYGNTTGYNNNALGRYALYENSNGVDNTAVGSGALHLNVGSVGCGVLHFACCTGGLDEGSCGSGNTAVGNYALYRNRYGSGNTAVGNNALYSNEIGTNNIAVGYYAGSNLGSNYSYSGSNNIDIGNVGVADESNTIRIGTVGTQTATYIAGINGATSSAGVAVYVDASGHLGTTTSSARFKTDIQNMGDSTSKLMQLRPVRFRYKQDIDSSGLEQYGLVAEEVAKVYPDLIANDADGQPYTVRYQFLAPMLLNEVQKQAREITKQQEQIATLSARLEQVEAAIARQPGAPTTCTAAEPLGVPGTTAAAF